MALLCFILAIICWFLGFINFTFTAGGKPQTLNWLCGGLMFAGLGLWVAPLLH
jgi:hypothetical protein